MFANVKKYSTILLAAVLAAVMLFPALTDQGNAYAADSAAEQQAASTTRVISWKHNGIHNAGSRYLKAKFLKGENYGYVNLYISKSRKSGYRKIAKSHVDGVYPDIKHFSVLYDGKDVYFLGCSTTRKNDYEKLYRYRISSGRRHKVKDLPKNFYFWFDGALSDDTVLISGAAYGPKSRTYVMSTSTDKMKKYNIGIISAGSGIILACTPSHSLIMYRWNGGLSLTGRKVLEDGGICDAAVVGDRIYFVRSVNVHGGKMKMTLGSYDLNGNNRTVIRSVKCAEGHTYAYNYNAFFPEYCTVYIREHEGDEYITVYRFYYATGELEKDDVVYF
jgi:hypothetical protein